MKIVQWFLVGSALGIFVYIGGYFFLLYVPLAPVIEANTVVVSQPESVNLLFVGDVMLDRAVATHAQEVGWEQLFVGAKDLFMGHDLLVGNLEGTITTNQSIAQQNPSILAFTFATTTADLLARVGFNVLSLANNHSFDFGRAGYDQTVQFLTNAGVATFGSPYNNLNLETTLSVHGKKVCLVGYMQLFDPDTTNVINEIKTVRSQCDYLVVMAHWGVEYQHLPTQAQRDEAHAFIDAGADVVVGGHPHVVEPMEIYNNHAIFYSLGNFLFDQGFSPQVKRGLALEIDFAPSSTSFILTPVNTYKEVSVAASTTAAAVLEDVVTPYLTPDIAEEIKSAGAVVLEK